MKAALLPDRGVVKVAGDDARTFLNGMLTTDISKLTPERARFGLDSRSRSVPMRARGSGGPGGE